jgi:hypothetical protein
MRHIRAKGSDVCFWYVVSFFFFFLQPNITKTPYRPNFGGSCLRTWRRGTRWCYSYFWCHQCVVRESSVWEGCISNTQIIAIWWWRPATKPPTAEHSRTCVKKFSIYLLLRRRAKRFGTPKSYKKEEMRNFQKNGEGDYIVSNFRN